MLLLIRSPYITADAEATGVGIATWFLASTFLIMYISRQTVKFVMLRKFQLDDYLMTIAMLLSLGLSMAYSFAADHGLGNKNVTAEDMHAIQKAYYSADLLYILATCCVKVSLIAFYNNLAVDEVQKRIIMSVGAFCLATTIGMLFTAVFQCGAGGTVWEVMTLHCFNQSAFWASFGAMDISAEACLIFISFMLVWTLRIPLMRKAVVVGCFAPRILVIIAAACRIAYLYPITPHRNPAFNTWKAVVCTEVQICLSISTACIPCIKPFFDGVEAGVWQADQLRRQGFVIDDLYSKGYAKAEVGTGSSPTSAPLPSSNHRTETEDAKSASIRKNSEIHALPVFERGRWQGSL